MKVKDTGVGVQYEDQDKLFKLFGFVKDTQALNTSGIGLGLVISEQIVLAFDGKIDFDSVPAPELNHGSVFEFTLKLGDTDESCQDS